MSVPRAADTSAARLPRRGGNCFLILCTLSGISADPGQPGVETSAVTVMVSGDPRPAAEPPPRIIGHRMV